MGKNEKKTLEIDILAKLVENNITSKLDQIANSINNIENKKITPEVDTSKIKKQSTKTKDIVKDLNKFITKNLGNGFEIPISTKLDEQILKEIRGTISNKITEVKKVLNPKQESYKTILGLTDDKFITDFATKNIKGSASARTNNLLKKQLIAEQDKDFYKTAYTNILTLREGIEEDEKKLRGYTGDLFSKKNIPFNDDEFFSIANVRREYANKINEYNKLNNVLGDKFKLVDKIYSSKAEENQYLQNFDNAYIQRTLLNIKGVQQLLSVMTSVEDVSTSVNSSLRTIKSTLSLVTKGKFDFYSTKISTTDSKSIAANMRDFANLTLEEAKSEFKKQYSEHIKNPDRNKENLSKPAALYGAYLGLGGNPNDLGINIDEIKGYIGEKDIITRYMQKYYENKIEAKRLLKLMTRLKNPNEIDDIIAKEKKKAGRPKKESIERPDSNKQEIESKKKVSETPVIEQKPKEKKPKKEKPVKQAEPKKEEVTQEETPAIQEKPKKQATKKQTKKQAKKEELKAVTDTTPVVQQPVIEEKKKNLKKQLKKSLLKQLKNKPNPKVLLKSLKHRFRKNI